jgi:FixJ family two-component response regulator
MQTQIFVISMTCDIPSNLGPLATRCGLPVTVVASAESYLSGPGAGDAICFVVDLPGQEGAQALQVLRKHGVEAPAILIADPEAGLSPDVLSECAALDVLHRPASQRELLGWIECVCAANLVIARARTGLRSAA